jgi:hypothetical protein
MADDSLAFKELEGLGITAYEVSDGEGPLCNVVLALDKDCNTYWIVDGREYSTWAMARRALI